MKAFPGRRWERGGEKEGGTERRKSKGAGEGEEGECSETR
jgi:hypothetical protein